MSNAGIWKRFWSKVDIRGLDDCWPWQAATGETERGLHYGRFSYVTHSGGRGQIAHRCSYEITHGPIPDGMMVRHRCDNPVCVNPRHLETGTARDNCLDRYERGRDRHALGEKHGNAKLTEQKVREIRALVVKGTPKRQVARMYGISDFGVKHAITGWKHVA